MADLAAGLRASLLGRRLVRRLDTARTNVSDALSLLGTNHDLMVRGTAGAGDATAWTNSIAATASYTSTTNLP